MKQIGKHKIHYAWLVMVACCFMCFGTGGILYNSIGIFMPAVCADMGFTTAQFSMYLNARQIVMVALLPVAGALIPKIHPRYLLTAASLCGIGSMILLATTNGLLQLYTAGAACGIAAAFLIMTMTPIILKKWFKKKYGMAIGIATAFTGIGGMIMNPTGAYLIEVFGWRTTALVFASISALCTLPFTLFVLKKGPEEIGVLPYGQDEKTEATVSTAAKEASGSWDKGLFVLTLINAMLIAIPQAFNSHCSQFGVSIGKTAIEAAAMSSAFMIGNTTGKLALGTLVEKLGTLKTLMLGVGAVILGFLIMTLSNSYFLLLAGALLGGISMSLTTIAVPLLVGDFFSAKHYDMILSYATMSSMFITGIAMSAFGIAYDAMNTYRPSILAMVAVYGLLAVCLIISYRKKK